MKHEHLLRLAHSSKRARHLTVDSLSKEIHERQLHVEEDKGEFFLLKGQLGTSPRVAVVGARSCDPYGRLVSRQLGRDLAELGVTVVSGGAEGCDIAAHLGALDVGGKTVVVLPGGHDHAYPKHHVPIYHRVSQNGGVLSPFWPDVTVSRSRFLSRNKVIVGLSDAVIVVRAEMRSGTMATARMALKAPRPLAVVPGPLGDSLSEGPLSLLAEGAFPIVSRASLLRWLENDFPLKSLGKQEWPRFQGGLPAPWELSDEHLAFSKGSTQDREGAGSLFLSEEANARCERLLKSLSTAGELDLEALAVQSEMPFSELTAALVDLEVMGKLERLPSGRYRKRAQGV